MNKKQKQVSDLERGDVFYVPTSSFPHTVLSAGPRYKGGLLWLISYEVDDEFGRRTGSIELYRNVYVSVD